MKSLNQNSRTILYLMVFAALIMAFLLFFGVLVRSQCVANSNGLNRLAVKFKNKFHEIHAAGNSQLELKLVDGYAGGTQKYNQDILKWEEAVIWVNVSAAMLFLILLFMIGRLYFKALDIRVKNDSNFT